jgi:asparagine synthase (glutamine-hydrolysing)
MCGILAVLGQEASAVNRETLADWNDLAVHRGPDGSGVWIGAGAGLAHRRLSILDLSEQGAQPMADSSGCVITYNGEIYNYRELRSELESLGEDFRSGTDTEVVLAAYRTWGMDCVHRFNGMWAFAIYDPNEKRVFCSRDRFGIKPLYYFRKGDSLLLSSEIRQLLSLLPSKSVNRNVLCEYLIAGFLEHQEETFFEVVKRLPGGHRIVYDIESGESLIDRWYQLEQTDEFAGFGIDDSVSRVRELLESSVTLRLRADVKAGTCLSGGIDSSAIASLAAQQYRDATGEAFCAIHARGSDGESDESEFAEQVAKARGLELHFVDPTYEDFSRTLDTVVESQEEPFGSTSVFMQYFVMEKAREIGCPVMLDGQGGDEVFLGYEKYFPAGYYAQAKSNPFAAFGDMAAARRNNAGMSWKGTARYTLGAFFGGARYRVHRREMPFLRCPEITGTPLIQDIAKAYRDPFAIQRLELEASNLPVLLRYEDKNSMAHSIEARVPFLDYRLVELAANLPWDHKLHHGWAKYVLRKAVDDIIPAENLWRREKFGFNSPHSEWMRRKKESALVEMGDSTILRSLCEMDHLQRDFTSLSPRTAWRFYNVALWERVMGVSLSS